MANYTQYRNNLGNSSAPDTILNNYISSFHSYVALRTGADESVLIIGDSVDDTHFKNSTVYTYNSTTRQVSRQHQDNTSVTVYQSAYVRGDTLGIPSISQTTVETNIILFVLVLTLFGALACKVVFKLFEVCLRRFRR